MHRPDCGAGTADRVGPGRDARFGPAAIQPLSLRRNFSWIATGNAVEMAAQWGLVVVLARLSSMEAVGLVVLAFALCAPVVALANLGLRGAVVTDALGEYQFGDYLALRLVTAGLALAVIGGMVWTTRYDRQTAWVILAVGLGETFKAVGDIFHALLQQHERMDRIAISQMIRGLGVLAMLGALVHVTGSVAFGALAFPIVSALTLVGYDLPNGARIAKARWPGGRGGDAQAARAAAMTPRWNLRTMLRLTWLTLPLGIVLMLIALNTSLPRCTVDQYLGKRALGIFVSIFYMGMIAVRVVSALSQSGGPRLARYYASANTAAFGRLLGKLLGAVGALGAGMTLVVAVAGGPILESLYGRDYQPYLDLAVYLMVAATAIGLTIPLGIAVEAMRCFKTHMAIRAIGILVLWAVLPGWTRAAGLEGVARAMLLSAGCTVLGCTAVILWATRLAYASRDLGCSPRPAAVSEVSEAIE